MSSSRSSSSSRSVIPSEQRPKRTSGGRKRGISQSGAVDNAQSYTNGQAEQIAGRIFRKLGLPRVKYNDRHTLNRKFLIDGINGSLQRLQMDYIDII